MWATVKMEAEALGADIVSPGVNFCGGDCNTEVCIQTEPGLYFSPLCLD